VVVAAFVQVVQEEGTATVMEDEEGRGEQVEEGAKGGRNEEEKVLRDHHLWIRVVWGGGGGGRKGEWGWEEGGWEMWLCGVGMIVPRGLIGMRHEGEEKGAGGVGALRGAAHCQRRVRRCILTRIQFIIYRI